MATRGGRLRLPVLLFNAPGQSLCSRSKPGVLALKQVLELGSGKQRDEPLQGHVFEERGHDFAALRLRQRRANQGEERLEAPLGRHGGTYRIPRRNGNTGPGLGALHTRPGRPF